MFVSLACFYFFYFALLGAMVPYLGLYFESQGLTLLEISQLTSILMLTKVLAPNIWGYVADRTGRRLYLVRWGSVLTALSFAGFFWASTFWSFAIIIVLYSFFWNAVLAQFEVITLHNLGERQDRYSRIRLWGSVGFVVAVAALGWLFEHVGVIWLPAAMMCVIVGIAAASFLDFAEPAHTGDENNGAKVPGFLGTLKRREVMAFFIACLLLQVSHGAYYTYYSIYLEHHGYSKTAIGLLWALGVLAEVLLFIYMHRWLRRYSDVAIMIVALGLTALRWLLIGYGSNSTSVLVFAQLLHAFSFGAMHAAAIHFVHRVFPARSQGRAQALYSSAGFGLGGAIGAFLSGLLVTGVSYSFAFVFSAVAAVLAAGLLFRYQRLARN